MGGRQQKLTGSIQSPFHQQEGRNKSEDGGYLLERDQGYFREIENIRLTHSGDNKCVWSFSWLKMLVTHLLFHIAPDHE